MKVLRVKVQVDESVSKKDAWCNGLHVCFPNLPPMILRGFESRSELESSGCSMWHFLKFVARGFLRVLRFPPLLHRFNGSANKKKKAQINAISTLSNLIAELSLRTKWHVTWHLHVISARCVGRDLHTTAPGPLERTCWRQFARATWAYVLETVRGAVRRFKKKKNLE